MQYTTLGSTDLRVSRLCLGTVFRQEADETVYRATIDAALEGCNFLDTSNVYLDGDSERVVGRAIKGQRDQFVITTKVGAPEVDEPSAKGLGRENILRCCEKSLRRLDTDVIDLYLCHFPDPDAPLEETIGALDTLVQQGKVRHIGCSGFESWRLDDALRISERLGQARFCCNQLCYSLLDRRIEEDLLAFCGQQSVGVTVFAPTAIGLLCGRHRYGQPPPIESPWHRGPYNFHAAMTPQVDRVIAAVIDVAQQYGRTPTQVALAWCLSQPVDSVIVGCDSPQQVCENFAAADWMLPAEARQLLDEISRDLRLEVRHDCPQGYQPLPDPQSTSKH